VIYVGRGKTGRDGISTAHRWLGFPRNPSSAEFNEESQQKKRPNVAGPAIRSMGENCCSRHCLEAMQTGAGFVAIQDMGAAGLTSFVVRDGRRAAGLGIEIELGRACPPNREPGMTAYEMMLSANHRRRIAAGG